MTNNSKYAIVNHTASGIKVFVMDGPWSGVFIIFDNFNKNGDKGTFTYEFAGLPTHLMYLLKENLTPEQESSMMELVNDIAKNIFSMMGSL